MKALPPVFEVHFEEFQKQGMPHVRLFIDGVQLGDDLNDNAYEDDGFRYHDAFHLSYFVHTGHSTVVASLLAKGEAAKKSKADLEAMKKEDVAKIDIYSVVIADRNQKLTFDAYQRFHDKRKGFEEYAALLVMGQRNSTAFFDADGAPKKHLLDNLELFEEYSQIPSTPREEWKAIIKEARTNFAYLRLNEGGILVCDQTIKKVTYKPALD